MGHYETLGLPCKLRFHKGCGSIRRLQVSPHSNHEEQRWPLYRSRQKLKNLRGHWVTTLRVGKVRPGYEVPPTFNISHATRLQLTKNTTREGHIGWQARDEQSQMSPLFPSLKHGLKLTSSSRGTASFHPQLLSVDSSLDTDLNQCAMQIHLWRKRNLLAGKQQ